MGLCTEGAIGASLLYSLGGADKHWEDWFNLDEDTQIKLRRQIRTQSQKKSAEGRAKTGAIGLESGALALATARSATSRADDAQSRYATMYKRLRTLKKLPPPLSDDDVHEWFKDVQSDLAKFTHAKV